MRSLALAMVAFAGCADVVGIGEIEPCPYRGHYGTAAFSDDPLMFSDPLRTVEITSGPMRSLGFDGTQFPSPDVLALPDDVTDIANAHSLLLLITTPSDFFPDGFAPATVPLDQITFPDQSDRGVRLELIGAEISDVRQQVTSTFPASGSLEISSVSDRFVGQITDGSFGDNRGCVTLVDKLTFDVAIQ